MGSDTHLHSILVRVVKERDLRPLGVSRVGSNPTVCNKQKNIKILFI